MAAFRDPRPRDTWITFAWLAAFAVVVIAGGILSDRIGLGLFLALVPVAASPLLRWMSHGWGYRCPECGEVFQLSIAGQFTAVNMGDERSVRCPRCGKRSWVKPLRKTS